MRLYHFFFALLIFVWGGTCALNRQMAFPFNEPEILYPGSKTPMHGPVTDKITAGLELSDMAKTGKKLFRNNCASCHNKNMQDDMSGPALGDVQERWEGRETLLTAWIQNSTKVLTTGDPYAVALFEKWNKSKMPAFSQLTEEDIAGILAYIEEAGN